MAPNVASNGVLANGNGVHQNGNGAAHSNGNGTAARPAVAPKSSHEDRWAGVERPYSQVCFIVCVTHLIPRSVLPVQGREARYSNFPDLWSKSGRSNFSSVLCRVEFASCCGDRGTSSSYCLDGCHKVE